MTFELPFFGISFENELLLLLAIPIIIVFLYLNRKVEINKARGTLILLRIGAFILLLAVLATPFMIREETIIRETTSILLITDKSSSMSLYESIVGNLIYERMEATTGDFSKVNLRNLTTKNRTAIGNIIYENIIGSSEENNVVVLLSDGNNNFGRDPLDIASFASEANTVIFTVTPELTGNEVYISDIIGAKRTPIDFEYRGDVVVRKVGDEAAYKIEVAVDGILLIEEEITQKTTTRSFPFSYKFRSHGVHNITARITPTSSDTFSINNIFYKVVDVIKRPAVLLVSENNYSALEIVLKDVYDVTESSSISSLDAYTAVILDNLDIDDIGDAKKLRDFLTDGGGLLVVGGEKAFDAGGYYESNFESLLPVRSSDIPREESKQIAVVILIDISGSTGMSMEGNTKIDVEKAIAIKMIRDLSEDAHIAVVAFNADSHVISSLRKIENKTGPIEDKIAKLQFGGGTYALAGQIKAHQILRGFQGSKYIIMISDGITNYPSQSYIEAERAARDAITTYTVGVVFDTDESFLKGLARVGGGLYFAPDETERVKIILGEEDEGEEEMGGFLLLIVDHNHFITQGLEIGNVTIKDFNKVTPKSSAQLLVATQSFKPILTVWRFGLGRVAALPTDDGNDWANNLYGDQASRIISATVNWVIGDPERKKPVRIECDDVNSGEETAIIIKSKNERPEVILDDERIELSRLDQENYYFNFYPDEIGLQKFETALDSCTFAVNYPEEYGEFEINKDLLKKLAEVTGGKNYDSSQLDELQDEITNFTIEESSGIVIQKTNLMIYFILGALCLFFLDIVIRRINEIVRGHKIGSNEI